MSYIDIPSKKLNSQDKSQQKGEHPVCSMEK